jgi:hypothetical protein
MSYPQAICTKGICMALALVFAAAQFAGCSFVPSRLQMLNTQMENAIETNLQISKSVLDCFDQSDKEGLKTLLCAKTQMLPDIDEQILMCFELFDGKVDSFDKNVYGYEGKSIEQGDTVLLERAWSIDDIVTNKGESYEIHINTWNICKEDTDREGIAKITVTRISDSEQLVIGYEWPRHYDDGRDLSTQVVNAFSEHNINNLQALLCAKTLKSEKTKEQLQAAVDFFEGAATKGVIETRDGRDLYDGLANYRTFVSDYEIIENGEPVHTSIAVFIENIKTDTGQIYTMEYHSFLLDADKEVEGISQIVITNNDGIKRVIGKKIADNSDGTILSTYNADKIVSSETTKKS